MMIFYDSNDDNEQKRPPSTTLREEVMDIGGREIVTETEAYIKKADGSLVRQRVTKYEMAAEGRWVKVSDYGALSYSGYPVPRDSLAECLNPFDKHDLRLVYINLDGFVSERGNVLCADCLKVQRNRLLWKEILFFGLIYNPQEY